MESTYDSYASYQSMLVDVTNGLEETQKICRELSMNQSDAAIRERYDRLKAHKFAIGILGEFNRGKSTVINSLLEKEIVPADILPCSATMNRITYDMQPKAEILMKDGSRKQIAIDSLKDYVTKLDEESEQRAEEVEEAIVSYPCRFCQNGVDIIDTPGLNDAERMNRVTENVIPKLDVVIMVITPDAPFSMSEAEFVRSKLMDSELGRVIFLVNKMDCVRREADKIRVLDQIKTKIQKTVLEKMKNVYGENSDEYKAAEKKLGEIRVYPFSALDALEGKIKGDQELIAGSGTVEFEKELTRMLTEERGALELDSPLSAIQHYLMEAAQTANNRKQALQLDKEEFVTKQKEASMEIKRLQEDSKAEVNRLKSERRNTLNKLREDVREFYPQLEEILCTEVENFPLTEADVKRGREQATAAKMEQQIAARLDRELSNFTEREMSQLLAYVGKEAENSAKAAMDISDRVSQCVAGICQWKGKGGIKGSDVAIDVATTFLTSAGGGFLPGMGGAVAGFRTGGIKGAAVGGLAGVISATGALQVLGAVMGSTIVAAPILIIPAIAIAGVVGTFTGNNVVSAVFHKDISQKQIQELRNSVKANIKTNLINRLQETRTLESWVKEKTEEQYDYVIKMFEDECERVLSETQVTLDMIKRDLAKSEAERMYKSQEYDELITRIQNTWKRLLPTYEKMVAILGGDNDTVTVSA